MGLKSQIPVLDKSKIQFNFGSLQNPRPINLPVTTSIPSTLLSDRDTESVISMKTKSKKKRKLKIDKDVNELKHDLSSNGSVSKESSIDRISERNIKDVKDDMFQFDVDTMPTLNVLNQK